MNLKIEVMSQVGRTGSHRLLRDNPQSKFMELSFVQILIASCALLLQKDCSTVTTLASTQLM